MRLRTDSCYETAGLLQLIHDTSFGHTLHLPEYIESINKATQLSTELEDNFLAQELDEAAKAVLISGKNTLLAIQKINIQPTILKHQEELISSAQSILLGTLKILQLEDDSEVRTIIQAADWLLDCLIFLQTAEDMSRLLTSFREFSEALLLVNSLTERRILELKDSTHQLNLSQTLQTLRKCVPMLYTTTHSNITHPKNKQMNESKWYIFDLTTKTIHSLKFMLTNKDITQEQVTNTASFFQQMYYLLSNITLLEMKNCDMDFLVGAIIFYCMFVADCSRPIIKIKLVKHCQKLLESKKSLFDHLKGLPNRPSLRQTQSELEQKCISVKVELDNLNQMLVSSIFYQILDSFCNVNEPLKRLLKAALKTKKTTGSYPSKSFQHLFQAFQNRTNQLLNIATLIIAKCPQSRTIAEIQSSTDCLCRVRDAVVVLLLDPNKAQCKSTFLENAQSLYQRWVQATESLLMSFDGLVTIHEFLDLSIKEFEEHRQSYERLLRNQECEAFHLQAVDLCSLAKHVVHVVNRYIDQSNDPIFRNGLRVLVRQLESSVQETRNAVITCVEAISCVPYQNNFLEALKHLFDAVYKVRDGVKGYRHPDLISPLRDEVYSVDHKPKITEFNEFDMGINLKELTEYSLSCERYLSKPLPCQRNALISKVDSVKPSRNTSFENSAVVQEQQVPRCNSSLEPSLCKDEQVSKKLTGLELAISELLTAVKRHDLQQVSNHCSSLLEIAINCTEVATESMSLIDIAESGILMKCKDIETLTASLSQFNREEETSSVLVMDQLTQTAILLCSRIGEIRKYLISIADYWHSFSYQLFCDTASPDVVSNTQIFNRTMRRLAAIAQLISESINSDCEPAVFSVKQQPIVKIHIILSKSQIAANHLLTKAISHSLHCDKVKLEYMCILWSVITQQLLRSIDDFIGLDIPDLAMPNITESKSCTLMCETALWIQEAAALTISKCAEESVQKTIRLLKEEVAVLRKAILKLRNNHHSPTTLSASITVDWVLLQREIIVKMGLLVQHLKNIYQDTQGTVQNVVNLAVSAISNKDKIALGNAFEKDARLLVEKIDLLNETVKKYIFSRNHENITFMTENLSLFTTHVVTRARALVQNHDSWEVFILEAMSLKWSAKANQLISHLQADIEIDDTTLTLIKQCLQMTKPLETQTTYEPIFLRSGKENNKSICSADINVSEQQAAMENKPKVSFTEEHIVTNGFNNIAANEQNASCFEKLSEIRDDNLINVNQENKSTAKEQIEVERGGQSEINKQKASLREQRKKLNREQYKRTTKQQQKYYNKKPLDTLDEEQEDTINEKYEVEKNEMKQKEMNRGQHQSDNQKIYIIFKEEQQKIEDEKQQTAFTLDMNESAHKESQIVINANFQERTEKQEVIPHKKSNTATNMDHPNSIHEKAQKVPEMEESAQTITNIVVNMNLQENSEKSQDTTSKEQKEIITKIDQPKSVFKKSQGISSQEQLELIHKKAAKMEVNVNKKQSSENSQVTASDKEKTITTNMEGFSLLNKKIDIPRLMRLESSHKMAKMEYNMSMEKTDNYNPQIMFSKVEKTISTKMDKPKYVYNNSQGMAKTEQQKSPQMIMLVGTKENVQEIDGEKQQVKLIEEDKNSTTKHDQIKCVYTIEKLAPVRQCMKPARNITKLVGNMIVQEAEVEKLQVTLNQDKKNTINYKGPFISAYNKLHGVHKKESLELAKEDDKLNLQEKIVENLQDVFLEEEKKSATNVEQQKEKSHPPLLDIQSNRQLYRCPLAEAVEAWEGESNTVVQVTKDMAIHMSYMTQYLNKKGPIQTSDQLISSAKCIAAHGQTFVEFVRIMAKNCTDRRSSAELLSGMEQIQTISNQLSIISSVKAATGCDDSSGEDVLVKNAQNLIHRVLQTWKAAEVACIKGTGKPSYDEEETEVAAFLTQWRQKLLYLRRKEVAY